MKRGINKVVLLGTVGVDPDARATASGDAVTNISVATSESWGKDGEQQERTEWHKVVFFGRLAEIVRDYVRKGSKIYVEGKLQTNEWERDGVKRYTTEIVASEMQMLDKKNHERSGKASDKNSKETQSLDNFEDDDIPFGDTPW